MNIQLLILPSFFAYIRAGDRKVLATRKFDTMEVVFSENIEPPVTELERDYIGFDAGEYQVGQVLELKGPERKTVVLGPQLDYPFEVELHACGNPDHDQYSDIVPRTFVRVMNVTDAGPIVQKFQGDNDMGGGNCGKTHGVVWKVAAPGKRRERVGKFSYNGRYVTAVQEKAEKAEWDRKFAEASRA